MSVKENKTKRLRLRIRDALTAKGEYYIRALVISLSTIIPSILVIFAILSLLGILTFGKPSDFIVFAVVSGTGIYGGYTIIRSRRIEKIERHFPDFVRDLAESKKSGMTFTKAIFLAAKGNYGELTPEIKKMARQISWGKSVNEAFSDFAKRVGTPLIKRIVSLIIEASRGGGSIADVLEAAAKDAAEIKFLERERKTGMASYVIIVYIGALAFLIVVAILCSSLLPKLTGGALTLPGLGGGLPPHEYKQILFYAALLQSFGSGMVAGMFEVGRWEAGVKHSCILVLITWIIFRFLIGID